MFEDRTQTIRKINELHISKTMIAQASGIPRRRVGDFVTKQLLPDESCARIKETVSQIVFVWDVFSPYRIPFTNPEELKSAYATAQMQKAFSQVGS